MGAQVLHVLDMEQHRLSGVEAGLGCLVGGLDISAVVEVVRGAGHGHQVPAVRPRIPVGAGAEVVDSQGDADLEGGTLPGAAAHGDLAAVEADDLLDQGESQARSPADLGGVGSLTEAIEDVREVALGDARPRVGDRQQQGLLCDLRRDLDLPALSELEGVGEQVSEHHVELVVVEPEVGPVGAWVEAQPHVDAAQLGDGPEGRGPLIEEMVDVLHPGDPQLPRTLFEPGEVEQLIDESQQPVLAALGALQLTRHLEGQLTAPAAEHILQRAEGQGDGGAELMGDVGDEGVLQGVELLELHRRSMLPLVGGDQRLPGALPLGDIDEDPLDQFLARRLHRAQVHRRADDLAIPASQLDLEVVDIAGGRRDPELPAAILVHEQVAQGRRPLEELGRGPVSQHPCERGVDRQKAAVEAHTVGTLDRALEEGPEALLRLTEGRLRPSLLRDLVGERPVGGGEFLGAPFHRRLETRRRLLQPSMGEAALADEGGEDEGGAGHRTVEGLQIDEARTRAGLVERSVAMHRRPDGRPADDEVQHGHRRLWEAHRGPEHQGECQEGERQGAPEDDLRGARRHDQQGGRLRHPAA